MAKTVLIGPLKKTFIFSIFRNRCKVIYNQISQHPNPRLSGRDLAHCLACLVIAALAVMVWSAQSRERDRATNVNRKFPLKVCWNCLKASVGEFMDVAIVKVRIIPHVQGFESILSM